MNKIAQEQKREWIIKRCINAFKNQYENQVGYCEKLMTRDEMMLALEECIKKYSSDEFRGHNVVQADKKMKMPVFKLDAEEKELSDSFDRGEWKTLDNLEEVKAQAKEAATNYFKKFPRKT
jgi:hypothetical protein